MKANKKIDYKCVKCGESRYESGEIRTTRGFWTKIFNIQNRKFISLSCNHCGYTEFYSKDKAKTAENVLDFFTN